ncbi:MAG: hypothetical protein JOZ29_11395 [Deltaproteobacteria bacterium]|nr:hypothetical protein [Deltaproteobacteria bacterium]
MLTETARASAASKFEARDKCKMEQAVVEVVRQDRLWDRARSHKLESIAAGLTGMRRRL